MIGYGRGRHLALNTFIKLLRATDAVMAETHRHLSSAGVTPSQFGVLEVLHHLGPLDHRTIGRKILKSSGNITTVIDNLEKRGLVRRQRQTDDRRFVTVSLTDPGRRLVEDLFPRHAEGILERLSVLTPAEQQELGRLCRKLGRPPIEPKGVVHDE